MIERQIQRIQLLFSQNRFKDAEQYLFDLLSEYPDLEYGQYLLAVAQLNQGKHQEAFDIITGLCERNPGELEYIELKAELEIVQENFKSAEDTVNHLIRSNAENDTYYFLLARIKYSQRNYDAALTHCNQSLALNPDNLGALNLSLTINSQLGRVDEARLRVKEALQRNPENPYTIANHGLSLLNEGNTNEALEKFKESLSINPNNDIARYGMMEGLKSKFWPYKMLYKFGMLLSRLSGKNIWVVIIGAYLFVQLLQRLANSNPSLSPYINPIIYFIVFLFIMTWILDPIMNIYLLTNKYGRLLLDKETVQSAKYCAASISVSIINIVAYFLFNNLVFLYGALFFFVMLIPLGTMYKPNDKKNQKRAITISTVILITGILGLLVLSFNKSFSILGLAFILIFAYQWIINGMMIKESSRRFD
ncbi:MAG: tetratricopeptide repeat protein [Bacteroidia bacterium]|nr:tetratricopeptide repeat protein [Bacteroidia bacterium]